MKILQIIKSAYRAINEEQDDTVLWVTQAMQNAGGEFTLLLTGNAVCYGLTEQKPQGLVFGDWKQSALADLVVDLKNIMANGAQVYAIHEDVQVRGLGDANFLDGVEFIRRDRLPAMFEAHDQIWQW